DPPGGLAALPADPDDDPRGALCRRAADVGVGGGRRTAPAARPRDLRRAHREPDAHALHDARHLPRLRPARAALAPPPSRAPRGPPARVATRSAERRMNLSQPFIRRPVATVLLTIGLPLGREVLV